MRASTLSTPNLACAEMGKISACGKTSFQASMSFTTPTWLERSILLINTKIGTCMRCTFVMKSAFLSGFSTTSVT